MLRIREATVIDADYDYPGNVERPRAIRLAAGLHPFRLFYARARGGVPTLLFCWSGPGIAKQAIPASAFRRAAQLRPAPAHRFCDCGVPYVFGSKTRFRVSRPVALPNPARLAPRGIFCRHPSHKILPLHPGLVQFSSPQPCARFPPDGISPMKPIPVSLQLYSLRDDMQTDFARTVAKVAQIGYAGVELAGYGRFDAKALKVAIGNAGLKVSGLHIGLGHLRADLNAVINDVLHYGAKHVICPSWPAAQFTSAAACQHIGEQLAEIGRTLRAFGLQLSFHNHADTMKLVEGRTAFDWMLSAAAPRDLMAEPDVYWLHVGGVSPARFLRDHGARCPLLHLKDEKELGLGPVDFPEIFSIVEAIGAAEWYVVEQEEYNHAPLESVRLCFEQLKKWGKV